jgi:hypothetical protein
MPLGFDRYWGLSQRSAEPTDTSASDPNRTRGRMRRKIRNSFGWKAGALTRQLRHVRLPDAHPDQARASTTRYQAWSVMRPSLPMNGARASRTACATATSPEFWIASAVGPAPTKARSAASESSKTIDNSISLSSKAVRPAAPSVWSSFPGSDRAKMPLCFMLSSASGGKRGNNGLNTQAIPDSDALVGITTATGPCETRRASARARALSSDVFLTSLSCG